MRSKETKRSHLRLLPTPSDTTSESSVVWTNYGPLRAGLITLQDRETARANKLLQLSDLLNILERNLAILQYKLAEACATSGLDIETLRAERGNSISGTDTTNE